MKKLNIASILCGLILCIASCGPSSNKTEEDSTKDKGEVTIGSQVWTSKNLDVSKFKNGEEIPEAETKDQWKAFSDANEAAWCYYENKGENGTTYGKLYNWYAVNDPRGLAPAGYHIPSDEEWTTLTNYLGGETIAGAKMKSNTGWENDGNGTNSSAFAGLPGGFRDVNGGFYGIGAYGTWWSSSEPNANSAWFRYLSGYNGDVSSYDYDKQNGFSVRCLRD
jgi:uncharacterized protein (TIGR02145 family)